MDAGAASVTPRRRRHPLLAAAALICCSARCGAWVALPAAQRHAAPARTHMLALPLTQRAGRCLAWTARLPSRQRNTCCPWSRRQHPQSSSRTALLLTAAAAVQSSETQEDDLLDAFEIICDEDGLLSLEAFLQFDEVSALLEDGLLGTDEVEQIWLAVAGSKASKLGREGFMEAFGKVDELFEDFEEPDDAVPTELSMNGDAASPASDGVPVADEEVDEDLATAFVSLAGSRQGAITLEQLLRWQEVRGLIDEEQLTEDEVTSLFQGCLTKGSDTLTLSGFARFNAGLDDLFEDDLSALVSESAAAAAAAEDAASAAAPPPPQQEADDAVDDETSDVEAEFVALAGSRDGLLTLNDVLEWDTITELVADGQMDREEVLALWDGAPKTSIGGAKQRLGLAGFVALNEALDALFEFEEEDENAANAAMPAVAPAAAAAPVAAAPPAAAAPAAEKAPALTPAEAKDAVLRMARAQAEDCGLGAEAAERMQLLRATETLARVTEDTGINIVESGADAAVPALAGRWRLLYTSSRSMEFNQGLTGIARTIRGSRFSGLTQDLLRDGEMLDCNYTEELGTLQVTITGDWEVRETTSLLSGARSVALDVTTKRVKYGFMSVIGERWKPLRAMALLDIVYLDQDLRVMRGQTSTNTIFILVREDA